MCTTNTDCEIRGECCNVATPSTPICSSNFYNCLTTDGKLANGEDCTQSNECASACCSNSGSFCTNKTNECPDDSPLNSTVIIVTSTAIAIVLIAVIVVLICVCLRKRRHMHQPYSADLRPYPAQPADPSVANSSNLEVVENPAPPEVVEPVRRQTTELDEQEQSALSDISSRLQAK